MAFQTTQKKKSSSKWDLGVSSGFLCLYELFVGIKVPVVDSNVLTQTQASEVVVL